MPDFRLRAGSSTDNLESSLLQKRGRSWSDRIFEDLRESPLHDLVPVARPGLTSRVSRCGSVGRSLESLSHPFLVGDTDDTVKVQGGYTSALLWAAAIGVLPAAQYGFNNGCMNTAAVAMRESLGIPAGGSGLDDGLWGFCVSVFCLGALFGCSAGASLADTLGRRSALATTSATFVLGAFLEAVSALPGMLGSSRATGVGLMVLGRAVSGAAAGATTVAVPMYLGEIAPPHLRGALGTMFQLTACVAMLGAQVIGLPSLLGTRQLWPIFVLISAVPWLFSTLLHGRLLESPHWLVRQGAWKAEAAQEIIAQLRGLPMDDPAVEQELEFLLTQSLGQTGARRPSLAKALQDPGVASGLTVCVCCAVVQQFSGINNAFNYSSTFLVQNGLSIDLVMIITVLMNVGNVLVTLLSTYLMDRVGRRTLLLGSSAGMMVCILALTVVLRSSGQPWTPPCAVLAVVGLVMSFGIGLGPVPWLLPAELFSMDKCALGTSLAASSNWLANFAAGQVFLPMATALEGNCFMPFALVLMCFLIYVHASVPETRGKTLDQIIDEMRVGKKPRPRRATSKHGTGSTTWEHLPPLPSTPAGDKWLSS